MADTLVREGVAYGSQPLSPVPQYWDGASAYAKVYGVNGAIRVILYNSAGETFINSAPATVQIVTSAGATNLFSGTNPAAVKLTATSTIVISGTATVNFSGSGTVVVSGTSTVAVSGTATVNFSGSGTVTVTGNVTVATSSGAETFIGANPASVQLTATSTVNFSGSGTVAVSGTATVNFSGSGTVVISGASTVVVSGTATVNFSGSSTVEVVTSAGGTALFSTSNPAIAVNKVIGSANNTWSANATISAGATSTSVDLQYCYRISYFGEVTNTATITLILEVSQDNSNFYQASSNSITAGTTSPFHYSTETAARYVRLTASGVSATITATIAGK